MIGTTVGKYQILERLGRGGMGIVYKALDETLDREVAIKVLNPDVNDAELLKRFRAEAVSLARLNHPGIATIYELHRHGDEMLMVMEYVRGETLQALSERMGPLELPQAAHVCTQILDALSHAHRAGIVHRDLKPANVMVTEAGIVKIMDFGIARMLGGEHYTHAGYMMGTPAYMAPEQVLGEEIDGRADLYSVGVLFFRLLTRELPFKADTAIAMAQKQVAEAPTPLRTFRPNLPPWCEAIIARALSKSPGERFQSAEAFRAAIVTAVKPVGLGELPTMATPTPASLRTLDLTVPLTSELPTAAATMTRGVADLDVTVAADAPASRVSAAVTPASGTIPPAERTGTTVVLGRGHLLALAAMIVVLIGGIAVLGYIALKRGGVLQMVTTAPPDASAAAATSDQPPNQQPPAVPVEETAPPQPTAGEAPKDAAAADVPASAAATTPVRDGATNASGTAGREAREAKPKPSPKSSETPAPPSSTPAAAPPPPKEVSAPASKPELPAITFDDVKVVLADGDNLRDRDAVMRLMGDHLAVLDDSGTTVILTLPYAAIVQAFYSRSKQPKWKGPDGKEAEASVDLGALGFFRGERNWLILTTQGGRVIVRVENDDLQSVLTAVQERTGVAVQRSAADR